MAAPALAAQPSAKIMVHVADGTRQPFASRANKKDVLVTLLNGDQDALVRDFFRGPSIAFESIPFSNNLRDNFTVLVSADGYNGSGFQPVKLIQNAWQFVHLMLVPKDAGFQFADARWEKLRKDPQRASLVRLFETEPPSGRTARANYMDLLEEQPAALAGALNIMTAMESINLSSGSPLDYCVAIDWERPPAADRFYAWAETDLLDLVRIATEVFGQVPSPAFFHPGATRSYKETRFSQANVQITFHESTRKEVAGKSCMRVELDIDYFRDLLAHTLLEVVPNTIGGTMTDPKQVYVLRWVESKRAGVPEFNPPYTLA